MNLFEKCRETALSVLPVMVIVTVLGLFAVPSSGTAEAAALGARPWWIARFLTGGALLILGLTVFLLGVDLGIRPMGERCGAALTRRRSLTLLLGAAFVIGLVVTAAEPDIQVFGDQVRGVFPWVRKAALTVAIAGGVGVFTSLGLFRTAAGFPLKTVLAVSYAGLFLLSLFAPDAFVGIAFDSGGATTGPMTVPFIMALGLGVAGVRARANAEGGFGLTGVASIGPVAAVLLYAILNSGALARGEAHPHAEFAEAASHAEFAEAESHAESAENAEFDSHAEFAETAKSDLSADQAAKGFFDSFDEAAPSAMHESLLSIAPLFGLFLLFQFTLLRMTARQVLRLSIGFVWALFGLTVFLTGVNGGFMQAGRILGAALGGGAAAGGTGAWALLVGTGLAFGAIIVCAEPAVWVLSEQVEEASGGAIRRRTLLVFLSIGTALAIGLAMWRAVAGFPLWRLLLPGYALALLLLVRAPALYAGIAFDSGGVASGPLTSTFILSFTLGAASGGAGGNDSFGVIALVAMMPLLAIQLMGILVERGRRRQARRNAPAHDGPAPSGAPSAPADAAPPPTAQEGTEP